MVWGVLPDGRQGLGRRARRRLAVTAACALCLLGAARAQDGGAPSREVRQPQQAGYSVKASHLARFPAFVTWPSAVFEAADSPLRLCIAGADPFGPAVDRIVREERLGDHPITVVRLPSVAKGADCQMLFLSASRDQTPREALAAVAGRPILTVADDGVDAPGAMIQFVTVEGRVRFEIRPEAAQAEGLMVSSKLLSLSARGNGQR